LPQSGADVLARPPGQGEQPAERSRLAPFFECWLDTFIFDGRVDAKLRELAILRLMWRCNRSFEWANHYRLARHAGLSRDDVTAIRTSDPQRDLSGDVALVVRAADEVVDTGSVTPDTCSRLHDLFPEPDLLQEFLYLVAGYRMFAAVSTTTGTSASTRGLRMWPPDGVGPPISQS
jgi:alkylhydroperoxidase family enzyme